MQWSLIMEDVNALWESFMFVFGRNPDLVGQHLGEGASGAIDDLRRSFGDFYDTWWSSKSAALNGVHSDLLKMEAQVLWATYVRNTLQGAWATRGSLKFVEAVKAHLDGGGPNPTGGKFRFQNWLEIRPQGPPIRFDNHGRPVAGPGTGTNGGRVDAPGGAEGGSRSSGSPSESSGGETRAGNEQGERDHSPPEKSSPSESSATATSSTWTTVHYDADSATTTTATGPEELPPAEIPIGPGAPAPGEPDPDSYEATGGTSTRDGEDGGGDPEDHRVKRVFIPSIADKFMAAMTSLARDELNRLLPKGPATDTTPWVPFARGAAGPPDGSFQGSVDPTGEGSFGGTGAILPGDPLAALTLWRQSHVLARFANDDGGTPAVTQAMVDPRRWWGARQARSDRAGASTTASGRAVARSTRSR